MEKNRLSQKLKDPLMMLADTVILFRLYTPRLQAGTPILFHRRGPHCARVVENASSATAFANHTAKAVTNPPNHPV